MEVDLLCLFLLVSALTFSVQSTPHEKRESLSRWSQNSEEKDDEFPKLNDSILPTFYPFEASSPEPEDEDVSKETSNGGDGADEVYSVDLKMSDVDGSSIPVLLSEEMLVRLIKASEEQRHDVQKDEEYSDEDDTGEVADTNEESVEITLESNSDEEEQQQQQKEKDLEKEEVGSSIDSEIPLDLDYAADATEIHNTKLDKNKPLSNKVEEEAKMDNELPTVMEDYDTQPNQDYEDPKVGHQEKPSGQAMSTENLQKEQILSDPETDKSNTNEDKESMELAEITLSEETKGEMDTNGSVSHAKGKRKNQINNKRVQKAQPDQALSAEVSSEHSQNHEPEKEAVIVPNVAQRKRGKWASLLGKNPVQIRAAVDRFPRIRPTAQPKSRTGADPGQEASVDSCENFHCKRGKTCKLNDMKKPSCVCQEPANCPSSLSEFDHVCGTDNQTYDSSCQLFATKCSLEGSKKGHRLHLDYSGSCKFIPPCLETELIHFPLRMRDWLKNVLLQLYEQDFLTAKQRSRVQKIYENERRLHPGDHPVELLARDFEKNYNMYIYPVHWQFAQMDQHPSDRFLSHSELAPLRAPLVPMEHCTSVFFHECDADKDKLLSFREWCQCFGIKDEDTDTKLLF